MLHHVTVGLECKIEKGRRRLDFMLLCTLFQIYCPVIYDLHNVPRASAPPLCHLTQRACRAGLNFAETHMSMFTFCVQSFQYNSGTMPFFSECVYKPIPRSQSPALLEEPEFCVEFKFYYTLNQKKDNVLMQQP